MNQLEGSVFGVGRAPRSWPSAPQIVLEGSFERVVAHPDDVAMLGPVVTARLVGGLETCVQYRLRDEPHEWVEEWMLPRDDERLVIVKRAASIEPSPSKGAWLGSLRHDLANQQFLLRTSLAGLDGTTLPPELADMRADVEHIARHCAGVIRTLEGMIGRHGEPQEIDLAQFLSKNLGLLRRVADPHTVAVAAQGSLPVTVRVEALRAALVVLVAIASALAEAERAFEIATGLVDSTARLSVTLAGVGLVTRRADLELTALNRSLRELAKELGATVSIGHERLSISFAR